MSPSLLKATKKIISKENSYVNAQINKTNQTAILKAVWVS